MSLQEKLPFLHQKPELSGCIRCQNSDFFVEEVLGFEPSGEGEHLWLWVEKDGQNTAFIRQELATLFSINVNDVATSGMKDRHAITRQWFALPYPIKKALPANLTLKNATILTVTRHGKKLKTGTHKANRFKITLRFDDLLSADDKLTLERRLQSIREQGVPNYFGEQRFGHNGGNIDKASALFQGKFKVRDKKKRGIYLSAARSLLFNQMIAKRLEQSLFEPHLGDVYMLTGSNSHFLSDELNDEIQSRYQRRDISLSASLWGKGELRSSGQIKELEQEIANNNEVLAQGLCDFGLKQERRSINLIPNKFEWLISDNSVCIEFELATGCFATSVLREVAAYNDASQKVNHSANLASAEKDT